MAELKKKALFNEHGDVDVTKRRMIMVILQISMTSIT